MYVGVWITGLIEERSAGHVEGVGNQLKLLVEILVLPLTIVSRLLHCIIFNGYTVHDLHVSNSAAFLKGLWAWLLIQILAIMCMPISITLSGTCDFTFLALTYFYLCLILYLNSQTLRFIFPYSLHKLCSRSIAIMSAHENENENEREHEHEHEHSAPDSSPPYLIDMPLMSTPTSSSEELPLPVQHEESVSLQTPPQPNNHKPEDLNVGGHFRVIGELVIANEGLLQVLVVMLPVIEILKILWVKFWQTDLNVDGVLVSLTFTIIPLVIRASKYPKLSHVWSVVCWAYVMLAIVSVLEAIAGGTYTGLSSSWPTY